MSDRNVPGVLTFVGFAISVLGIFYFAVEYIPEISNWGQILSLLFLGTSFASFAYYVGSTEVGRPFFDAPKLQWLRPSPVFYLLAIVCLVIADGVFIFGIEDLAVPIKVLINLLVGFGLIYAASRSRARRNPLP